MDTDKKICDTCRKEKLKFVDFTIRDKKTMTVRNTCKKCRSERESQRRQDNKEQFKEKDKAYYKKCKDAILARNKNYRDKNRLTIIEQKKSYYNKNKEAILQYHQNNKHARNTKLKLKKKTHVEFRIVLSLRSRLPTYIRKYKCSSTIKLLECTKNQLTSWIKYQFSKDMTWDNYGVYWHIDHVVPISFFDMIKPEEQKLCHHWTNLRPLCKNENYRKSNKIVKSDICEHMIKINEFLDLNTGYQANEETCWWRRVQLRYGKNPQDEEDFESFLKWIIRNEASKTYDKPTKLKVKIKDK